MTLVLYFCFKILICIAFIRGFIYLLVLYLMQAPLGLERWNNHIRSSSLALRPVGDTIAQ